jgi:uncharacterized protein YpiB (UPF0302 family)
MVEDYAVVYFGDTIFKVMRLIIIAASSVHFFACIFFRVKIMSANTEEDVTAFYTSRNIEPNVRVEHFPRINRLEVTALYKF